MLAYTSAILLDLQIYCGIADKKSSNLQNWTSALPQLSAQSRFGSSYLPKAKWSRDTKKNIGCRSGFGSGPKIDVKINSAPLCGATSGFDIIFGYGSAYANNFDPQHSESRFS
jgi:hypothetical protein